MIKKIIQEKLKSETLKINKVKGFDNKVYLVRTPKQEVVVRIPIKEKKKLITHAWASQQWAKQGIPVPKILAIEEDYLIEERIKGTDMSAAKLTIKQRQNIMFQLGKYVKKMHTVKTKKYGYFIAVGIGEKESWRA